MAKNPLHLRLTKLLAEAKALHAKGATGREAEKAARALSERFDRMLAAAWPLLTDDEAERVAGAFEAFEAEERAEFYTDGQEGRYAPWFFSLRSGASRLPEMTPEATCATLVAWLAMNEDEGSGGAPVACDGCGLARPAAFATSLGWSPVLGPDGRSAPLPHVPSGPAGPCPNCGCAAHTWDISHSAVAHDWQKLDGVMPRTARQG